VYGGNNRTWDLEYKNPFPLGAGNRIDVLSGGHIEFAFAEWRGSFPFAIAAWADSRPGSYTIEFEIDNNRVTIVAYPPTL